MSRLRMLLHGRYNPPPAVSFTNASAPQMSGIPRQGEEASIWPGEWSSTPNAYRYTIYRDGALVTTASQSNPAATEFGEYHFTFSSSDAGTICTAFVEASVDGGSAWSAPVECYYSFYPDTQLVEPASIAPDLSITRTSSAGSLPVAFSMTGTVYPSFYWQLRIMDDDFVTEKYTGTMPVREADLASPFTLDLTLANPVMPSLVAGDILMIRLITQDYGEAVNLAENTGAASKWVAVSDTNFGGNQYYKLVVSSVPGGTFSGSVVTEIELRESSGGADISPSSVQNITWSGGYAAPTAISDTFGSWHCFDGNSATFGALFDNSVGLPQSVIIDCLIPRPVTHLAITSEVGYYTLAPGTFTIGPCSSSGTYIGSPASYSGQTFSNSADETKTFAL